MPVTEYFDNIVWEKNVCRSAQNLNQLRFRLILAGIHPPQITHSCELGFGNGISLIANAASSPDCRWHGTDFNDLHFQYAQKIATECELELELRNLSFGQYNKQAPCSFQAITLMGGWSWITPDARKEVVSFLLENLSDGGVFSFDYLTDPGQAQFAPFRKFIRDYHRQIAKGELENLDHVRQAMAFVRDTMEQNPWYLRAYPDISEFLSKEPEKNPEYFLHEFLNANWEPMSFSEISDILEPADLTFGCSAEYSDAIPEIHLDARQRAFLSNIESQAVRETAGDFIRLRGSRNDYWIKHPKRLDSKQRIALLNETHFALLRPPSVYDNHTSGTLGRFLYQPEISQKILNDLGKKPTASLEALFHALKLPADEYERFCRVMAVLISEGMIATVRADISPTAQSQADRYNDLILSDKNYDDITVLTSPLTGGGLMQTSLHKRFLQGIRTGITKGEALRDHAIEHTANEKRPDPAEALHEAELFLTQQTRILHNLGIS